MRDRRHRHEDFIKERRKGGERRQHQREPVSVSMELTAGNDLYFHVSGNLSAGGAFFDRAIPHPVGTEVELIFQLPGDDPAPIRCRGQVVNVPDGDQGLGMGVRFAGLSDGDEKRIAAFVSETAPGDGAAG